MTITNWPDMTNALSKTRRVIAVEMQGHGRTADIKRDFSYQYLADDIAAMLDYLKVQKADVIGYSIAKNPHELGAVEGLRKTFRHSSATNCLSCATWASLSFFVAFVIL